MFGIFFIPGCAAVLVVEIKSEIARGSCSVEWSYSNWSGLDMTFVCDCGGMGNFELCCGLWSQWVEGM